MIMDFSLRGWLLVLGIVVILGVLLDGFRRMQKGKRNSLKMAIDKTLVARSGDKADCFNGELPNGGARVVNRQATDETYPLSETADNTGEELLEAADPSGHQELMPESLFADDDENEAPEFGQEDFIGQRTVEQAPAQTQDRSVKRSGQKQPREAAPTLKKVAQEPPAQAVEQVIVINVFAREGEQFNGSELMQVILPCGMRYGHLDIFHRTEGNAGEGSVQFSMANAIKPGTFDLEAMDRFQTPGVTFFLSLPGPENNMKAFDYMLETARCVAKHLDGELKDEHQSDLSPQIIGHSRQVIRDFERRQLSLLR